MSTTYGRTREETVLAIRREKAKAATLSPQDLFDMIAAGRPERARGILMYLTPTNKVLEKTDAVLSVVADRFADSGGGEGSTAESSRTAGAGSGATADTAAGTTAGMGTTAETAAGVGTTAGTTADAGSGRELSLRFLVGLACDLKTFPAKVHLERAGGRRLVEQLAQRVGDRLSRLSGRWPKAAECQLDRLRKTVAGRLTAEEMSEADAAKEADRVVGSGLPEYVHNVSEAVAAGNLFRASLARLSGDTVTQLGNDYAAYLDYTLWQGATFETTNPVLVKMAWDIHPERWNQQADGIIAAITGGSGTGRSGATDDLSSLPAGPGDARDPQSRAAEPPASDQAAVDEVASAMTMAVVMENCLKLRDIFLYTEGREGYVSLQVNPKNHADAPGMVAQVRRLYGELTEQLDGVPNVVFKLPATRAGLVAAGELTADGVGVTITLTFSLFQATEFAKVLNRGNALVSYIAIMNGRLAYPVRDELRTTRGDAGVKAARMAGVEVARKAARVLYRSVADGGLGVDPERVKIMIASLRIYDGWIPDVSELWGIPLITVFPNVRRAYEAADRPPAGSSVEEQTDSEVLEELFHSELFRQAWWMPGDEDRARPERVLTLSAADEPAVIEFQPVADTIGQFNELYDQMCGLIRARMGARCAPSPTPGPDPTPQPAGGPASCHVADPSPTPGPEPGPGPAARNGKDAR